MYNINKIEKNIKLYGTYINISIYNSTNTKLLDECEKILHKYNLIFSMYNKNSELYKINYSAFNNKIRLSEELYQLIKIGKQHSLDEDSNLNICIAPMVNLWNIGFSNHRIPDEQEIINYLPSTNPKFIELNENTREIKLLHKDLKIDLGALAKGYIADKIRDFLIENSIDSAIINLGGNIITLGYALHRKDFNFKIGLQHPKKTRKKHIMDLYMNNKSIVTSGVYERNFIKDNKIYHHILDPKTGYPIKTNMSSISIISDKSIDGEIWTSKLFGKSFEFINEKLKNFPTLNSIIIYDDDTIKFTKNTIKYMKFNERN